MQRTLIIKTDSLKRYQYWKDQLDETGIKYDETLSLMRYWLTIECLDEELDISFSKVAYYRTLKGICEKLCIPYKQVEFYYTE